MQEQNANTVSYLFKVTKGTGELARMSINSHCGQLSVIQEHQNIFNSVGARSLICWRLGGLAEGFTACERTDIFHLLAVL